MSIIEESSGEILPEEICRKVLQFLSAQDATSLISVNRFLKSVGNAKSVWEFIYKRDLDKDYATVAAATPELFGDCAAAKNAVVMQQIKKTLPSIKWYPLRSDMRISGREGHLACTMTCQDQRRIVITGGFSDDDRIYIINPGGAFSTSPWSMTSVRPSSGAGFVYGASLTPLPGLIEKNGALVFRAVRYGGFRAGGYSDETNEVAVLTITCLPGDATPRAKWTVMETNDNLLSLGRAYHTATLLLDRYILFIGGMKTNGSIFEESMLDTQTWTWLKNMTTFSASKPSVEPSGRHGNSVVLDSKRNRLVLFGGGSGSDLLRSGRDNTEVWEWKFGENWQERIDGYGKWSWHLLHGGTGVSDTTSEDEENAGNENENDSEMENRLSPAESLCLGRCHMSCKIVPDMVLLFFGSGQPSTNGIIAFDLHKNEFHRPNATGHLPCPRFTGASAACLEEGYILTHGGYSSQLHDSIGQFDVIDLVPGLRTGFEKMPVDAERPSHTAITDAQAEAGRGTRGQHLNLLQMFYASLAAAQRRGAPDSSDDDGDSDEDYEMDEDD